MDLINNDDSQYAVGSLETYPTYGSFMKEENKKIDANENPTTDQNEKITVHWIKFSFIVYFSVCGGSFGTEQIMNSYPAIAFLLILMIPILWNMPISLITSELGLAMPSNEGMFIWIHQAFGPLTSFISAIAYWINYSVSSCVNFLLIYNYLQMANEDYFSSDYWKYGVPLVSILLVMLLNMFGVQVLGSISGFFALLTLLPFVVLFFWSLADGDINPKDWIELPPKSFFAHGQGYQNILVAFNIALWNNSGYESVGSFVEELRDPPKTLSKSLYTSNIASTLTYLVTFISVVGLNKDYSKWKPGDFAKFAALLGGKPFKYAMIGSAVISNFACCNAYMLPCSMQLASLGEKRYMSIKFLTWLHPKYKMPWPSIFINTLVCCVCVFIPFNLLVSITNLYYSILIIMMCIAAVLLRYTKRGINLKRPYLASRSNLGLILIALPPTLISLFVIVSSVITSWWPLVSSIATFVLFFLLYVLLRKFQKRKIHFYEFSERENFDKYQLVN